VVDGNFGPKTKARVIDFQRANGLSDDGIAGPFTNNKLFESESSSSRSRSFLPARRAASASSRPR
jgi:peptidoglycan hydrolase-like protein with peptidoglycan-binding domain